MSRSRLTLLMIGLAAVLLLAAAPVVAQDEAAPGTFEAADCLFAEPSGADVDCGYLTVPENRANPDGPTIRLAVGIFHSTAENPAPDPIVYLEGGPGGNPLEAIPFTYSYFEPFLTYSDVIIFDQRGTGYSEPALDCPEVIEMGMEYSDDDLPVDEALALYNDALSTCRDRLSESADLSAYNSAANAADLDALRAALGYDQWNVYGISYGTRLAQTAMRDFPAGIRSVILDSAYPIESDLVVESPANAIRAFRALFDTCAADAACSAAFPDLETTFRDTITAYNDAPEIITVRNPLTGETLDVLISGDFMVVFLFQMLYSSDIIPSLPQLITEIANGDLGNLGLIYGSLLINSEFSSEGMFFSVQCNEETPFSDVTVAEAALAEIDPLYAPALAAAGNIGPNVYTVCAEWGAGVADAIENEPITSDIPTLVQAGSFDPITPPRWGEQIASNLSSGYFFLYTGLGHGVTFSPYDCPVDMALAFLQDPTTAPDDACIAEMDAPQFVIPRGSADADIALTDVSIDLFGVTTVVPDGWEEVAPGTFARGDSALDQTAIVIAAGPVPPQEFVDLLATQLRLEASPELAETRAVGDYNWDLYNFVALEGYTGDLAVVNADGTSFIVLLLSTNAERDALFDAVFLPALAAFAPVE